MNKILSAIFILAVGLLSASAQDETFDSTMTEMRLNPEIEAGDTLLPTDYSVYPFIKPDKNKIDLNGDDWSELARKFEAAKEGLEKFSVVYLGDSHIQADFGGDILRQRLAAASRYAGRGLIIPFKIAGTNQPLDYKFSTSSPVTTSKLMRTPWATEMTFTGIGLQPSGHRYTLEFSSPAPTRRLRLHTRGTPPGPTELLADGRTVDFTARTDSDGLTVIEIPYSAYDFKLTAKGDKTTVYGGIELISDSTGTVVHSIGNNGATFLAYATIDRFGSELANLSPDLIIIALGTNEAFGRTTEASLRNNIDVLLSSIRSFSPDAKILLVGPTDCYKRVYSRRKGRRRRTATTVPNPKAATMARTIRQYAEKEGIPYYNHYAVAGSAAAMKNAKVLSRDGVHFTATGYRLWGNLLSDAILKQLQP